MGVEKLPYAKVADLPEEVKSKYKGVKLRQFMHVVNSEMESGKDESTAFAAAHSVAGKKSLGWDDIYEVMDRQLSQEATNYNSLGASDQTGCANCNWFVLRNNACILVHGDISPTGICDLWEAKQTYVPEPMLVTIVKEKEKSVWDNIKALFIPRGAVGVPPAPPVQAKLQESGIFFDRRENQPTRFFLWASNNFEDQHEEIITEAAHKEFVEWCDTNNVYPELWLWHAAGSKAGQVDWIDYADGFLVVSGLIAADKEAIVENLSAQEIKVSHGFIGRWKEKHILQYRSWEVSVLPGFAAANAWTGYAAIKEEGEMGFSETKRNWLMQTAGVSEDQVKSWEDATTQAAEQLKALGIEFKGDDLPDAKEDENVVNAMLAGIVKQQAELVTTLTALTKEIATIKGDDDSKIAAAIQAEIAKMPHGFSPSSDKSTITGEEPTDIKAERNAWFKELAGIKA